MPDDLPYRTAVEHVCCILVYLTVTPGMIQAAARIYGAFLWNNSTPINRPKQEEEKKNAAQQEICASRYNWYMQQQYP